MWKDLIEKSSVQALYALRLSSTRCFFAATAKHPHNASSQQWQCSKNAEFHTMLLRSNGSAVAHSRLFIQVAERVNTLDSRHLDWHGLGR